MLQIVIVILAGIGAFISVLAVGLPLVQRDQLGARLKAVAAKREELSRKQRESFQQRARFQPRRHVGLMKAIIGRLKLQNMIESKDLRKALQQAGWRGQSTPVTYIFSRIATPIVFVVLAMIVTSTVPDLAKKTFTAKMFITVLAGVFGYYLPFIILKLAISNRQAVIRKAFPDALDLLVICVDAGLSIEAGFNKVTEEMAHSQPLMAEEMGITAAELAFLGDRRVAYENLAERTGLAAVKSLTTALLQAEKYGTSISNALRVIAQEVRDQRMSAAEKKAAALPAKLTVPMILFFLPVIFIVVVGPVVAKFVTYGLGAEMKGL